MAVYNLCISCTDSDRDLWKTGGRHDVENIPPEVCRDGLSSSGTGGEKSAVRSLAVVGTSCREGGEKRK